MMPQSGLAGKVNKAFLGLGLSGNLPSPVTSYVNPAVYNVGYESTGLPYVNAVSTGYSPAEIGYLLGSKPYVGRTHTEKTEPQVPPYLPEPTSADTARYIPISDSLLYVLSLTPANDNIGYRVKPAQDVDKEKKFGIEGILASINGLGRKVKSGLKYLSEYVNSYTSYARDKSLDNKSDSKSSTRLSSVDLSPAESWDIVDHSPLFSSRDALNPLSIANDAPGPSIDPYTPANDKLFISTHYSLGAVFRYSPKDHEDTGRNDRPLGKDPVNKKKEETAKSESLKAA